MEYYHREVVVQLVGVVPALPLDAEPVLPGETECAAALRLLKRLRAAAPRLIDVLTLDAFYLQAPFVREVLSLGYGVVMVLKAEERGLYRDVEGLLRISKPETVRLGIRGTAEIWGIHDLRSWSQLGRPVRVVRELKKYVKRERIAGQWTERHVEEDWRWAVLFPAAERPPADLIRRRPLRTLLFASRMPCGLFRRLSAPSRRPIGPREFAGPLFGLLSQYCGSELRNCWNDGSPFLDAAAKFCRMSRSPRSIGAKAQLAQR